MDIRKINKVVTQRMLLIHLRTQYFNRVNTVCVYITIIDHLWSPDCVYHTAISNFNLDISTQNFSKNVLIIVSFVLLLLLYRGIKS